MDVEILVHGVPDGQDYYGIKEEQTNMGLFYDNSTESVKYVVEIKKQGSNTYAYYSYLRYKGLIGAGGRPGSYFGVTLRIDKYYQDAIHIYNLLDMMFKRYIIGTLLTPSGDGYKYLVTNFATKASEIDKIQQAFIQLIQTTCVSSKFLDIDASFIHPVTAAPVGNIVDVSEGAILSSIKKYSKVVLSPEYEMNIEKEYKKKLQDEVDKGNNTISQKDKIIAEKDGTISSLNQSVMTCQNRISALEQELKRKDADIQQQRQKGDLSQSVTKIKEPITALAEYFRVKDSYNQQQVSRYGRKNFRIGIINAILSFIVIVLMVLFLFTPLGRKFDSNSQDYVSLKTQYDNLSKDYNKLLTDYHELLKQSDSKNGLSSAEVKTKTDEKKTIDTKKKADDEKKVAEAKKKADDEKKTADAKKKAEDEKKSSAAKSEAAIIITPNVKELEVGQTYTFTISGYEGN